MQELPAPHLPLHHPGLPVPTLGGICSLQSRGGHGGRGGVSQKGDTGGGGATPWKHSVSGGDSTLLPPSLSSPCLCTTPLTLLAHTHTYTPGRAHSPPFPSPHRAHYYSGDIQSQHWVTTLLWSTAFLYLGRDLPIFDASVIKLFKIQVV